MSDKFESDIKYRSQQVKEAVACLLDDCNKVATDPSLREHLYREHLIVHLEQITWTHEQFVAVLESSGQPLPDQPPELDISSLRQTTEPSDIKKTWQWVMSQEVQEAIKATFRFVETAAQQIILSPDDVRQNQTRTFYSFFDNKFKFTPKPFYFRESFWSCFRLDGPIIEINRSSEKTQLFVAWNNGEKPSSYNTVDSLRTFNVGDEVFGIFPSKTEENSGRLQFLFGPGGWIEMPEYFKELWGEGFIQETSVHDLFRWYLNIYYSGCRFARHDHAQALEFAIKNAEDLTKNRHPRAQDTHSWLTGRVKRVWQPEPHWLTPEVI